MTMRSGFVTLVGRPNVGKSTLVNAMCGRKVSIVSDKQQTTRTRVRGILTTDDAQVVFVDTPGLHKPVTALGKRVNATALDSVHDVDVACLVIDATKPFGTGDQWVAGHLDLPASIVIVNKIDAVAKDRIIGQLGAASSLGASDYFPVSATTGEGIPALIAHLTALMPEGPMFYPGDTVSDQPEETWVAELVREQLLAVTRDELPYSIATRVTEWEWPRIRCEIIVERDSQKGMVIGKGGAVLKEVGKRARAQLPEGAYLELFVKVDKDWQQRADRVERLGYWAPTALRSSDLAGATGPERCPEIALEDLAAAGLRQLAAPCDRARDLVSGEVLAGMGDDLVLGHDSTLAHDHHRVHGLTPLVARHAEHGDLQHVGMDLQRGLDLRRVDVHATRDDHVLLAIAHVVVALVVAIGDVAHRLVAVLLILQELVVLFVVVGEDARALHEQLAGVLGPVARDLVAVVVEQLDLDHR